MANGQPIASRDARRLLKAVVEFRPFACSSREQEDAAWTKISDVLSGTDMAACDVKARFWYLLDVYTRHRMHGSALAGMSKGVVETLESVALCVNTYAYMPRNASTDCDTGTGGSGCISDHQSGDRTTNEPSHKSNPEDVIDRAFSGLSEMRSLLTQSQRECADQQQQLHHLRVANEQLHGENDRLRRENGQLQSQLASLEHQLDMAREIKTEHRARDVEAATRTQRMRSVVQSLAEMLDADAMDG